MADPVTLAMVGAAAGAAMKPKDPLRGAMLGATVGYTGGTALGVGGAASGAAAGSGAAATGGASAANTALANQIAGNQAASYAGGNILNAANAANTANATNLAAMNAGGMSFSGRPPIDPSMLNTTSAANTAANTAPSFMDKIGMAGKNAYENPMMTSQALSATNSLLAPDPQAQIQSAPAMPITAGRQLKPNDPIAYMNPYKESVIGNSQFSLI
jgi:hypothetical protein